MLARPELYNRLRELARRTEGCQQVQELRLVAQTSFLESLLEAKAGACHTKLMESAKDELSEQTISLSCQLGLASLKAFELRCGRQGTLTELMKSLEVFCQGRPLPKLR